ncbi:XLF-domain-containing protein [Xylariaceae sp. AK1471]|nr:XLF-domain-containing protein [Xylariaceae sp. AK1471]
METPSKWYPLPVFPKLPALLVSARFTPSSYTLYVTDLANIWVEKLERKGILLRSLQENTSIDLSDADPEQWAVFLSKLKVALDPTSSDHHLTSLSIAASPDPKHADSLSLHITCDLPKPLDALKWPVHLVKCQPASLASELVLPLIQAHHVHCRETEDLMNQLKVKDAVITKLLDKLSTMHTPLELIFNSLSAKHATTRAAAEDKIKGLAPFNEARWRSQRSIQSPQDAPDLLQSVFGGPGFSCETDMDMGVSDTLNDWWTKLGPGFRDGSKPESFTSRQIPREQVRADKVSSREADDEDFQVQATPPHIPQSSRTLHADEDDTASESEDGKESAPAKYTRRSNTRLGTIGESRQSSPPKTKAATPAKSPIEANDETASGSDSESDNPPRLQSSPSGGPTTPRKGGLGRIGGKSKLTAYSSQAPRKSTPGTTSDDSTSSKKPHSRMIGAIGRKPHTESKRVHSDTPAEPEEPETDEQKAERKRAELEKELNRKSAVPARKKRKF